MISISVIIPVYNGSNIIERTVEIINSSTQKPQEIILVNDGSSDNSLEVCRKIEKQFDNVKVVDKENGGIASARNSGLDKAVSDYVCFVDQDDVVDEKMYETAFSKISTGKIIPDIVIFSTGQIINDVKVPFEQHKDFEYNSESAGNELFKSFMFRGYVKPPRDNNVSITASIWKCVIRRDFLNEYDIRFRRFISYEDDYIFMSNILAHAKNVITSSHTGYYWVINNQSESHSGKYIGNYGEKVIKLADYIKGVMKEASFNDDLCRIAYNQLIFEKAIDVIDNEYFSENSKSAKAKKADIKNYLRQTEFFNLQAEDIRPLKNYHRIIVLYMLRAFKNAGILIDGMLLFRILERRIQNNSGMMRKINSGK